MDIGQLLTTDRQYSRRGAEEWRRTAANDIRGKYVFNVMIHAVYAQWSEVIQEASSPPTNSATSHCHTTEYLVKKGFLKNACVKEKYLRHAQLQQCLTWLVCLCDIGLFAEIVFASVKVLFMKKYRLKNEYFCRK